MAGQRDARAAYMLSWAFAHLSSSFNISRLLYNMHRLHTHAGSRTSRDLSSITISSMNAHSACVTLSVPDPILPRVLVNKTAIFKSPPTDEKRKLPLSICTKGPLVLQPSNVLLALASQRPIDLAVHADSNTRLMAAPSDAETIYSKPSDNYTACLRLAAAAKPASALLFFPRQIL